MKETINKPFFCPVPFSTLILNPDGKVGTCRELGTEHIVGDITTQSIDEIWNGEPLQRLRKEILSGNLKTCGDHQKSKNCNRLYENRELAKSLVDVLPVTKNPILRLSPDFNSSCNLKCPMCDIWYGKNGLYDELDFWGEIENRLVPNLIELDPLAGEPFIQPDLYRLMDLVILKNKNASWKFTTNAHWKLTDKIKDYLRKINIQYMSISIDTVNPDTYKKIRTGDFSVVYKNILSLIEFRETLGEDKKFDIILNFTVHRDNWSEVHEITSFALDHGIKYFAQYLIRPVELSILSLDENKRSQIIQHYLNTLSKEAILHCHRVLRALINTFNETKQKKYFDLLNVITDKKFESLCQRASGQ